MDIRRILKVYNYVNDDKRPKVNLKFVAVFAAFLLSVVALVGFFAVQQLDGNGGPGDSPAASSKTEYVGLSTDEIAAGQLDPRLAQERLADWKADHPNAVIESEERVEVSGVVVGYRITYREA